LKPTEFRKRDYGALGRDGLVAGLAATILSGIPSTIHSLVVGADVLAPTRAAGRMLVSGSVSDIRLLLAAAIVHVTISFFWASVLVLALPRKHIVLSSVLAAAAIAVVDLRVIAPVYFREVAELPFWPQMADHLMWGASFGLTLARRRMHDR
jgi:hypothetical protein